MAIKTKAGEGKCFACGREIVWRKTEGAALSCFCQHCDLQAYAKDGTEAERLILGTIKRTVPDPAKPAQAETPTPEKPKPAPKPAGVFGLGGY